MDFLLIILMMNILSVALWNVLTRSELSEARCQQTLLNVQVIILPFVCTVQNNAYPSVSVINGGVDLKMGEYG